MAQRKSFARYVPAIAGTLIVLIVIGALIWMIRGMLQDKPERPQRQVAQIVKLVRPPPPPPEPPPPPPPEERVEEPLPQETPEKAPPEDSQAPEQLGIDADGVAGGDGFGLAARRGGRDLVGSGGAMFAWYTTKMKDVILEILSEDERVRRGKYQVTVRVWVGNDGRFERVKLLTTTGSGERDAAIEELLQRNGRLDESPPLEMPQPATIRVVSR